MKSKQFSIFSAFLLVIGLTSCMNKFVDPSDGKAAENDQTIRNYLNANQLQNQATQTVTGLYYILDTPAVNADTARLGEELEFNYVLSYISANGQAVVVDSANKTKSAYIPFLTGVVVPGLEEGLLMMRAGQKGRFFMPSTLAFGGDTRGGKIPEYSPVIFDVTLKASRTEIQQMNDYATLKKLPAPDTTFTGDNIRVYRLTKGTGTRVTTGKTVTVAYTANLLRGTAPFDKGDSLTFTAGSNQYIAGFSKGVTALNVGDKALLVFPSAVGYGQQGSYDQNKQYYVVTPYTPLAFEITVKSVK